MQKHLLRATWSLQKLHRVESPGWCLSIQFYKILYWIHKKPRKVKIWPDGFLSVLLVNVASEGMTLPPLVQSRSHISKPWPQPFPFFPFVSFLYLWLFLSTLCLRASGFFLWAGSWVCVCWGGIGLNTVAFLRFLFSVCSFGHVLLGLSCVCVLVFYISGSESGEFLFFRHLEGGMSEKVRELLG